MYILKVTGTYSILDRTPEATMADMLRYDDGEMTDFSTSPISGHRARASFEAEVHTNHFTPERWKSFDLRATLIRKEPGKAKCNFPDMASVYEFYNSTRR